MPGLWTSVSVLPLSGGDPMTAPQIGISRDRIYPRCVHCRGKNYALAVLAYSAGDVPCAAVNGCGRWLPVEYRKGLKR